MKKFFLSISCLFISYLSVNAQLKQTLKVSPAVYFNGFVNSTNVDSSLYFIRQLAAEPTSAAMLKTLIHDSFAQNFMVRRPASTDPAEIAKVARHLDFNKALLHSMLSDGNKRMIKTLRPIDLWIKIRESGNDTHKQAQLTKDFMESEFEKNNFYTNNVGRYALLIHQSISQKKELAELSTQLLNKTIDYLQQNEVKANVSSASRDLLTKRAWQRFLSAYYNNYRAKERMAEGKMEEAENFFRTAFKLSPDANDNNHRSAYFYDSYFLTGSGEVKFQDDYLAFIQKHNPDPTTTLNALLEIALLNPKYKERLRDFYNTNVKDKESFSSFWMNAINADLKNAYNFSIKQTDGATFSTAANKGKWILIDYWGTWCGPCRQEHPDLQRFSQDIVNNAARNIKLITIACMDTKNDVEAYMRSNKYTFPVAMADDYVQKAYNISSYPSKILITPQGKYMVIPFGTDWIKFIESYTSL